MASPRDIKKRIKGVKNIQQITRTMEMVAGAKLRRSQSAAQHARPYAEKINLMVHSLGKAAGNIQHPLLKDRPVKKIALAVLTSNKGLCGAFNGNILRKAEDNVLRHASKEYTLFCVGKKARDYFSRRGYKIKKSYMPSDRELELSLIIELVKDLSEGFEKGEYDQVDLIYSQFVSPMVQRPTSLTLIPFTKPSEEEAEQQQRKAEKDKKAAGDYLFEPEPEELMAELIPKYLESQVYNALAQTQAGEHAARLVAMKSASDNAKEVIHTLTLSYNKARQASITKEILEIVSGSEAIKAG